MAGYILLLVVLAATVFLVKINNRANTIAQEGNTNEDVYEMRDSLLSDAERDAYIKLKAISARYKCTVFPKVGLPSLVEIPRGTGNWLTFWNRINSKYVDLAVCDADSLEPLAVIQLDDSAQKDAKIEKDDFIEKVLDQVGLTVLSIDISGLGEDELAAKLEPLLNSKGKEGG